MFITGPSVVKTVTHEDVNQETLGGTGVHTTVSGVAHAAFANEVEAIYATRRLLEYLPSNNRDSPPSRESQDTRHRQEPSLK